MGRSGGNQRFVLCQKVSFSRSSEVRVVPLSLEGDALIPLFLSDAEFVDVGGEGVKGGQQVRLGLEAVFVSNVTSAMDGPVTKQEPEGHRNNK
ncbi:hypothetical protein Pcinc_043296 [Petrolisthes cinctipes]|uniref:Uncharacterized protein n=1 Tax=Petrolisthes cinctipes TaxID=88211 RepID=A0AAE1EG84_PETCI|nr:hypothetical protein Pcinc_043296 [Petrolisthes cinctipes]